MTNKPNAAELLEGISETPWFEDCGIDECFIFNHDPNGVAMETIATVECEADAKLIAAAPALAAEVVRLEKENAKLKSQSYFQFYQPTTIEYTDCILQDVQTGKIYNQGDTFPSGIYHLRGAIKVGENKQTSDHVGIEGKTERLEKRVKELEEALSVAYGAIVVLQPEGLASEIKKNIAVTKISISLAAKQEGG